MALDGLAPRASRAALLGAACAVAGLWPFVRHLRDALPLGTVTAAQQAAFWLPWQLADNVRSGRGLFDAQALGWAGQQGLLTAAGNPGAAVFLFPLHLWLPAPVHAHNAGLLVLAVTNGAALALWARRADAALAAAAIGSCAGLWVALLGGGAHAAAWVAPGLVSGALLRVGRPGAAAAFGTIGAFAAPVPTAVAIGLACLLPPRLSGCGERMDPRAWRVAAAVLAGCAGVRAALPPLGAGAAWPVLSPLSLAPLGPGRAALGDPGTVQEVGVPIACLIGIVLCITRRGAVWRLVGAVALGALLATMGPRLGDGRGAPLAVDGFALPAIPADAGAWRGEVLAAAILVGVLVTVHVLDAAHGRAARVWAVLLAFVGLVEPRLQAAKGQPALWNGQVWPVPHALVGLPSGGLLLQLPLLEVRGGGLGWAPFHRQRVLNAADPADERATRAVLDGLRLDPSLGVLPHLGALGAGAPDVVPGGSAALVDGLQEAGVSAVVVHGSDASTLAAAQALFGPPDARDPWTSRWDLEPR